MCRTLSFNIILIVIYSMLVTACKKSEDRGGNPQTPADVYIVGSINANATIWKNGVATPLVNSNPYGGTFSSSDATAIVASGNDIYVSGYGILSGGGGGAFYWKNGLIDTVSSVVPYIGNSMPGHVVAFASSIAVSGNNVYLGGYQTNISLYQATYKNGSIIWKNGVPSGLGLPYSQITSIAVSNNDVYATGNNIYGPDSAFYYKNGVRVNLPGAVNSVAKDIFVVGNNVYVVGITGNASQSYNGVCWKDGVVNFVATNATFMSMVVSGNDVYISGSQQVNGIGVAAIWKNGVATYLAAPAGVNSYCDQVRVSGSDVYGVGTIFNSSDFSSATLWKNGVATTLAPATSYAWDIYISNRQ